METTTLHQVAVETVKRLLQGNRTDVGSNGDPSGEQDTYEFVAFVLWYLFLVLCCVFPTCCAYRRRRLVEARLAQHQSQLAQQQFNNMQNRPSFFLLDQLGNGRRNSERVQSLRTTKLGEELKDTTMTLSEENIEAASPSDRIDPERASPEEVAGDDPLASPSVDPVEIFGEDTDQMTIVRLPAEGVNANRTVSGVCAICLCAYENGDRVSWSPESACKHAFHTDCIIPWLAKKEEQKCPVCRQDYCQTITVDDELLRDDQTALSGDVFLDSFALALNYANYARAHQARNWIEHVRMTTTPSTPSSADEADSQQQQSEQQSNEGGGEIEIVETASETREVTPSVASDATEEINDIEQGTTSVNTNS